MNTRPSLGSSCAAIAPDIETTTVAKRLVRNRSTSSAERDRTTISRATQTCGRRARDAAAHPYQEWREFVWTTSIREAADDRQSRQTTTGHDTAYPTH